MSCISTDKYTYYGTNPFIVHTDDLIKKEPDKIIIHMDKKVIVSRPRK